MPVFFCWGKGGERISDYRDNAVVHIYWNPDMVFSLNSYDCVELILLFPYFPCKIFLQTEKTKSTIGED